MHVMFILYQHNIFFISLHRMEHVHIYLFNDILLKITVGSKTAQNLIHIFTRLYSQAKPITWREHPSNSACCMCIGYLKVQGRASRKLKVRALEIKRRNANGKEINCPGTFTLHIICQSNSYPTFLEKVYNLNK